MGPPSSRSILSVVLVGALVTAGCLQSGDEGLVATDAASPESSEMSADPAARQTEAANASSPPADRASLGEVRWRFEPRTYEVKFHWSAGVGQGEQDGSIEAGDVANGGEFLVPALKARIRATADWTCASPVCELGMTLYRPDHLAGPSSKGSSSLSVDDEAPAVGTWGVGVYPRGATAGVSGTITVVVSPE
jgi:hypothetical protein